MHVDLDLSSIYYFVWSLLVLLYIYGIGEALCKLAQRMEDVLESVRISRKNASSPV